MADKIFYSGFTEKTTPVGADKIMISDSQASNETKFTQITNLPINTATQTALNNKVDKTTTVNGKALSSNITLNQDDVGDGITYKQYSQTEKTKLAGIEIGAEVNNISDVNATDLTDGGDSSLHYHSSDRNRANHTGTQTASTISDFDTEVSNNITVIGKADKINVLELDNTTPYTPTTQYNPATKDYVDQQIISSGSGNVIGPVSSTDNSIVLFDGNTGKTIKDSAKTITTTLGNDDTTLPTSKAVQNAILTPTQKTDLTDGGDTELHTHDGRYYTETETNNLLNAKANLSGATFTGAISATNLSGTNTGDQTSIVGITGTKAQFDTACSDGNFVYTDGNQSIAGNKNFATNTLYVDDTNDRVGAGTVSPASPLHIYQNNIDTGLSGGLTIEQAGTGDSIIQFLLSGVRRWVAGIDNSDNDKFKISNATDLTNGVFTINTSGQIGIGTTNPDVKLQIKGIEATTSTTFESLLKLTDGSNTDIFQIYRDYNGTSEYSGFDGVGKPIILQEFNGNVGIGTTSPSSKAILDLTSTTQGFLPPRMTTAQRDAISSPAEGLVVYNTTTDKLNTYSGSAWQEVGGGGSNPIFQTYIAGEQSVGQVARFVAKGTQTITGVKISLGTLPTGADFKVDVRKNGTATTNSIFTGDAPISITTSQGATNGIYITTGTAIDNGSLVENDVLYFIVTQIGSTLSGTNLEVIAY